MLVLSRRIDESIVIDAGDDRMIEVTIIAVRGEKVRLGFTAPTDVIIHREEVYREIQAAGRRTPAA